MAECFIGNLRYLNRAKAKVFLNLSGKRGVFAGLPWLRSLVAFGAYLGLFRECWRASAQIVHQHSKMVSFGYPCAIAFPCSFQISVLGAFLGGLFGFIGFRCIFGRPVAFVGLVGLYACTVRRLEVRKRKTCKFIGFIGFIGSFCSCGCFAWFVLLLLRSCSLLVVLLVVLFPFG